MTDLQYVISNSIFFAIIDVCRGQVQWEIVCEFGEGSILKMESLLIGILIL